MPRREPLTSDDELLEALELGDVVIVCPSRTAPAALRQPQDDLAGPFAAGVAAAGQAVILTRDPSVGQVTALAWRHRLRADSAQDPRLRQFAEFWVGKGYAQARGSDCPAPG